MPTDELKELKREALAAAISNHQIPARGVLLVLRRIEELIKDHKASTDAWEERVAKIETDDKGRGAEHVALLQEHRAAVVEHKKLSADFEEEVKRLTSVVHLKGDPGEPGKPGKSGKAADQVNLDEIVARVLSLIPQQEHSEEVAEKETPVDQEALYDAFIERMRKEQPIDISEIRNAQSFMFNGQRYKFEELMRGAGGSGTSGGGGAVLVETPSGLINGVNKVYTTTQTISTVVGMWYNGEFIHPSEYTVSGAGFTMGTALPVIAGAVFTIAYQGSSTIPTGTGINPQVPAGTLPFAGNTNVVYVATGVISVVIADGQTLIPTTDYSTSYNSGTNQTTITYVQAPQSAVYCF